MEIWIALASAGVGSLLGAGGAFAVEGKRGRTQARERHLERRIEAYTDLIAQAEFFALVLTEPATKLASQNPFSNRLASARKLIEVANDINRAITRARLVSTPEGRVRLDALQRVVLESAQRLTRGAGADGIDVGKEAYAFKVYASSVVDAAIPSHRPPWWKRLWRWLTKPFRRSEKSD